MGCSTSRESSTKPSLPPPATTTLQRQGNDAAFARATVRAVTPHVGLDADAGEPPLIGLMPAEGDSGTGDDFPAFDSAMAMTDFEARSGCLRTGAVLIPVRPVLPSSTLTDVV